MKMLEASPQAITNIPSGAGQRRPRLVILMPMMWSIRNVILSGLLDLLPGVDVYLLLHKFDPSLLQSSIGPALRRVAGCEALRIPQRKHSVKGMAFLKEVIGDAFNRRNGIGSYAIYQRWYNRKNTWSQRLRRKSVGLLGYAAQPAFLFYRIRQLYNVLYQEEFDLGPIRRQIKEIDPDLILSTVNVDAVYERAYVLAAKSLGVPVVNAVLSFDNLTSKAAHLFYTEYIVWNQRMKEQLLTFYPQVDTERVWVTGTPQFDFHRRTAFLWDRARTLKRLGLPDNARYFLYSASPTSLTPQEPELIIKMAERMQREPALKDYWLVVRIHPHDDWSRWEGVRRFRGKLMLSETWEQKPDTNGWSLLTQDDLARLSSSLVHMAACINIASTISLDAAILDRPVIGIRFDHESDAPQDLLYAEYDTDHYRPLVESGGLRIAHTWEELMSLMQRALDFPEEDRAARKQMVADECGLVDGKATHRFADALITCLERYRR